MEDLLAVFARLKLALIILLEELFHPAKM